MACIIDNQKVFTLKNYAESHEIFSDEILRMAKQELPYVGDRPDHILYLEFGYRFVYSIENIPSNDMKSVYKIRRLSASSARTGKYPNDVLMKEISALLGFENFETSTFKVNDKDVIPNVEMIEVISVTNL